MPNWLFIKALFFFSEEFKLNPFLISQARHYFRELRENKFDVGGVTNVVKELTGKEPDDFETIVKSWIEYSNYKQRSFSNWLSALKKFAAIPFQSALSINELEKLNR